MADTQREGEVTALQFPDYETHTVEVTEKIMSRVADYDTHIVSQR